MFNSRSQLELIEKTSLKLSLLSKQTGGLGSKYTCVDRQETGKGTIVRVVPCCRWASQPHSRQPIVVTQADHLCQALRYVRNAPMLDAARQLLGSSIILKGRLGCLCSSPAVHSRSNVDHTSTRIHAQSSASCRHPAPQEGKARLPSAPALHTSHGPADTTVAAVLAFQVAASPLCQAIAVLDP